MLEVRARDVKSEATAEALRQRLPMTPRASGWNFFFRKQFQSRNDWSSDCVREKRVRSLQCYTLALMPDVPADRLRIGLVGSGADASIWRDLLSHRATDPVAVETPASLQEHELDLMLVFAEAVTLSTAAQACADPAQPPAVVVRLEPGRVHPLTALVEALAEAKREWETSFDALVDAVAVLDGGGSVIRANLALGNAAGRDIRDVVGRHYASLLGRALAGGADPIAESLADGEARTSEARYERLPGVRQVTTSAVPDNRGRMRLVVVIKDVTELKEQQDRMQQTLRLADLGRLAGGMAHEINTPLASIALRAESLLRHAEDPRLLAVESFRNFPRYLQAIDQEIFRCKKIINSVLDFSRARAPEAKATDLNTVARGVADLVESQFRLKQVRMEMDLDPSLPDVLADESQLRQALLALVTNALDASEPGGRITIGTRATAEGGAALAVQDEGAGISAADREKIFSPFFTTKPVGQGTGLGLAICHGIVQSHGGDVHVESEPGRGARFTILLPARPATGIAAQ
jgi:PAS domain S-box-containing protein